jgi:hypothetical protein
LLMQAQILTKIVREYNEQCNRTEGDDNLET